jgi:hypothetical protein
MKVESGIPIPRSFPFNQMQVGDSFAIPPHTKRGTVAVAAMRYGDKHGMKFVTKKMPDGSYRCWRTE